MKIITWNCLGALTNDKKDAILKLKPDVLVVQECGPQETFPEGFQPTGQEYIGDEGQLRGLAVFGFNGFQTERLDDDNKPDIKFFLPLRVFKGDLSLTLLAAWAWHKDGQYLDVFSAAVDHYGPIIGREKMLFLGDFNTPGTDNDLASPTPDNANLKKHLEIVTKMSQKGVKSLFHTQNKVEHGKEKPEDATLYYKSDPSKPFHCDYCFASDDMEKRLKVIEIGRPEEWIKFSDHMPLTIVFDL